MTVRSNENSKTKSTLPKRKAKLSITHDEFVRFIFSIRRFVIAFLKAFLPPETIENLNLDELKMGDCLFTDDKSLRRYVSDVALTVPLKGDNGVSHISIQIEHKSFSTNDYLIQLETYSSLRHRQEYTKFKIEQDTKKSGAKTVKYPLSRVIPFLLYNGKNPNPGIEELEQLYAPLPGVEGICLNIKPIVVNLRTINSDNIPDDSNCPELRIGLLALKLIFDKKPLESLETLLKKIEIEAQKFDSTEEALTFGQILIRYFSEKIPAQSKKSLDTIYHNFNENIGDNTMRGAALAWYNDLIAEGKAEGIAVGKAEGIAAGKTEGKAEGIAVGIANKIITLLSRKYNRVPKAVSNRICQIRDITVLDSLFISALDCQSLEEFKECLP